LLVDEVLAVGDTLFNKKCLEKMNRIAKQGLTVLFVSHNLSAISGLCQRVIVLEDGTVVFDGPTRAALDRYLGTISSSANANLQQAVHTGPCRFARITAFRLLNEAGVPCDTFLMGDTILVDLEIVCRERLSTPEIGIALQNRMAMNLQLFVSTWEGWQGPLEVGRYRFRVAIPKIYVYPGTYALTPWVLSRGERVDHEISQPVVFQVLEADVTGNRPYFEFYTQTNCEVFAPSTWSVTFDPAPAEAGYDGKEMPSGSRG
jgi:lipopolysaccharide transport system ATP-binding protein